MNERNNSLPSEFNSNTQNYRQDITLPLSQNNTISMQVFLCNLFGFMEYVVDQNFPNIFPWKAPHISYFFSFQSCWNELQDHFV